MGFSLPFIDESSQNFDLFHHLQLKHADEQQSNEIICPICAAMTNGEPNLVTADLLSHIANDHQHQQVQTPSTSGIGINPYSRQASTRDFDFTSSTSTRAGFRRGPLRTPSRRGGGGGGLGRGGGTVSQHFVVDTSTVNSGNDPIADLLTQLSTVRRLAAANNNTNSSSSSNSINLQTLTRQQYERERLRTTGRSHHQQQQSHNLQQTSSSSSPSNASLSVESDFFDSLFASALFIDPSTSSSSSTSNNSHQTWAQIVAQQQQQQQPTPEQQISSSTSKPSITEPDPSLLRKFCDESPSLTQQNNTIIHQQKRKNDFVHSLLFASFVCPLNDKDK